MSNLQRFVKRLNSGPVMMYSLRTGSPFASTINALEAG